MPNVPVENSVLLVQLSDSHLFAEAEGALLGMSTRDSLEQVVERVLAEQPKVDLVVASGDISQMAALSLMRRFAGSARRSLRLRAGLPVIMMNCRRWSMSRRVRGCLIRLWISASGG